MMKNMSENERIYVAGHNGMLGSSIIKKLKENKEYKLITRTSKELDLRNQTEVEIFFKTEKIDTVILAAAKVGSIEENRLNPAEFLIENLQIETNVITSAFKNNVKNLIFISSSCVYPDNAPQPLKEESIFTGKLEPENEAYGLAKLTGIKACEYYKNEYGLNYFSVLPTNLYGENDNFDPKHSHVIPAIMKRMDDAKKYKKSNIEVWGTGNIYREFLYVDDAADAIIFLLKNKPSENIINLGTGQDLTIRELIFELKNVVGYEGDIIFDSSKPDGIYKRQLDIDKLKSMGWKPKIKLNEGLKKTYEWYKKNI